MLSSLTVDNNKVNNWISPEKIKPNDTKLESTLSNLANGRIILKFNNSVFVHKTFLHYIVTSF